MHLRLFCYGLLLPLVTARVTLDLKARSANDTSAWKADSDSNSTKSANLETQAGVDKQTKLATEPTPSSVEKHEDNIGEASSKQTSYNFPYYDIHFEKDVSDLDGIAVPVEYLGHEQYGTIENHHPRHPYNFEWGVRDTRGNDYGQWEKSNGNSITGGYRLLLPDGRTQVVTYTADKGTGFRAQVSYEGPIKGEGGNLQFEAPKHFGSQEAYPAFHQLDNAYYPQEQSQGNDDNSYVQQLQDVDGHQQSYLDQNHVPEQHFSPYLEQSDNNNGNHQSYVEDSDINGNYSFGEQTDTDGHHNSFAEQHSDNGNDNPYLQQHYFDDNYQYIQQPNDDEQHHYTDQQNNYNFNGHEEHGDINGNQPYNIEHTSFDENLHHYVQNTNINGDPQHDQPEVDYSHYSGLPDISTDSHDYSEQSQQVFDHEYDYSENGALDDHSHGLEGNAFDYNGESSHETVNNKDPDETASSFTQVKSIGFKAFSSTEFQKNVPATKLEGGEDSEDGSSKSDAVIPVSYVTREGGEEKPEVEGLQYEPSTTVSTVVEVEPSHEASNAGEVTLQVTELLKEGKFPNKSDTPHVNLDTKDFYHNNSTNVEVQH